MPPRDSKHAPKTFKGKPFEVKDFLAEYEELLQQNNVSDNKDKCTLIRRYCKHTVCEILDTIITDDIVWADLKKKIEEIFDSDRNEKRYCHKDLNEFIREHKHKSINFLAQARGYYRKFQRITGWLKMKNVITSAEYNKAFWKGISKKLRSRFELRYLCKNGMHNMKEPFDGRR